MLYKFRKKNVKKTIWIILAILVLPAFLLWGTGNLARQKANYAGKIFGREISFQDLKEALQATRMQGIMQLGDKFFEVEKGLDLTAQAWDRLVLLAEAKRRRIKVSDKEVIEQIQSYPFFQKKERFDPQIYNQMLRYFFRTPARDFEEQTRQNLALVKLYKETTDQIKIPEEEIKEEYAKENEQISISYIAALAADFAKAVTASEGEIKEYFKNNSLQFKEPLSFNLEYVLLPQDDKDEKAAQEKINKILARLNKKGDFNKIAKDFGLIVKESGLFKETDPIPGIGWSPEILNQISNLKTGKHLGPILWEKNYYFLRLKERKEPYIPDLVTIKDRVKEAYIKDKSRESAEKKIKECQKILKEIYQINPKLVNLENTAKLHGLKAGTSAQFKYGSYIEGIGASDEFWIQARKLKEGEFSEIIETQAAFYIIKLKSKAAVDDKKYSEGKTEFSRKLLGEKKEEYFTKFLSELKKRAQKN